VSERGSIFGREVASIHCPIVIKFNTTTAGYWQIMSSAAELHMIQHFPPIVKT